MFKMMALTRMQPGFASDQWLLITLRGTWLSDIAR